MWKVHSIHEECQSCHRYRRESDDDNHLSHDEACLTKHAVLGVYGSLASIWSCPELVATKSHRAPQTTFSVICWWFFNPLKLLKSALSRVIFRITLVQLQQQHMIGLPYTPAKIFRPSMNNMRRTIRFLILESFQNRREFVLRCFFFASFVWPFRMTLSSSPMCFVNNCDAPCFSE